jgi:hypothetical protein
VSLSLVLAFLVAAAETYVVAPDGDDSHPGTAEKPWKTLAKASASVKPGDTVLLKAGEYTGSRSDRSAWRVDKAGTPEAWITYKAFGDGEVRIHNGRLLAADRWAHVKDSIYSTPLPAKERIVTVFQNSLPLHFDDARLPINSLDRMIPNTAFQDGGTLYVWLEDGSDPGKSVMRTTSAHVVDLVACNYTVFDGLTVEFGFNGFKEQEESHHVTIRNCVVRSILSQGIQPVPQDCLIEKNHFQKIGVDKFKHGLYGSKPGILVRNNVFEEIAGAAVHLYGKPETRAGGAEVSGNIFRNPRAMTTRSKDKYYLDVLLWARNDNRVFNNVFYGDGKRSGISMSGGNFIVNNTFVGCPTSLSFHHEQGNQIANNIFLDCGTTFLDWPAELKSQTLEHNLYFASSRKPRWEHAGASYATFEEYQKASGEVGSRYVDPALEGPADARPKAGSPAIDAGVVRKGVTLDILGTPRPQGNAPDIGAYEARAAQ